MWKQQQSVCTSEVRKRENRFFLCSSLPHNPLFSSLHVIMVCVCVCVCVCSLCAIGLVELSPSRSGLFEEKKRENEEDNKGQKEAESDSSLGFMSPSSTSSFGSVFTSYDGNHQVCILFSLLLFSLLSLSLSLSLSLIIFIIFIDLDDTSYSLFYRGTSAWFSLLFFPSSFSSSSLISCLLWLVGINCPLCGRRTNLKSLLRCVLF